MLMQVDFVQFQLFAHKSFVGVSIEDGDISIVVVVNVYTINDIGNAHGGSQNSLCCCHFVDSTNEHANCTDNNDSSENQSILLDHVEVNA